MTTRPGKLTVRSKSDTHLEVQSCEIGASRGVRISINGTSVEFSGSVAVAQLAEHLAKVARWMRDEPASPHIRGLTEILDRFEQIAKAGRQGSVP